MNEIRLDSQDWKLTGRSFNFPDGQPHISMPLGAISPGPVRLISRLSSTDDILRVLLARDALLRADPGVRIQLWISYLMGARMDRPMPNEPDKFHPFTLRVIADLLVGKFTEIAVFDPHSEVSTALLNAKALRPFAHIRNILKEYSPLNTVIVIPDAGATKRVEELLYSVRDTGPWGSVQCLKKRNPTTGSLSGFRLQDGSDGIAGRDCLIVDDLCDGGGTFTGLGNLLRSFGASSVDLYVSHGVFSKGCTIPTIDRIWTTNSYQDFSGVAKPTRFNVLDWYSPY